jgi:dinuclear metal center YbgI/SA1388 family protein
MLLHKITNELETIAPLYLQEPYDNSGLLIGKRDADISAALITLDVTEEILSEALAKNCNLIIAHHPVIFKGIKSLTGQNSIERIIEQAIKNDIAIYAIHTNLDNVDNGVNAILSKKIGLVNTRILSAKSDLLRKLVTFCPVDQADIVRESIFKAGAGHIGKYDKCSFNTSGEGTFRGSEDTNPFVGKKGELHHEKEVRIETIYPVYRESDIIRALLKAHPYEEVAYDIYPLANRSNHIGAGMIGELPKMMAEVDFLKKIKEITGSGCIRHSAFTGKKIKNVAVCGGSGSFLIPQALNHKADIFITGDIKYHDFFNGEGQMVIADVGHFESEQFAKELIYSILIKKIPTFAVQISETNTNSVNYL